MQLPIGGFCSASANFGQSTYSTRMGDLPFFKKNILPVHRFPCCLHLPLQHKSAKKTMQESGNTLVNFLLIIFYYFCRLYLPHRAKYGKEACRAHNFLHK